MKILLTILLSIILSTGYAQIITDRPDQTESPQAVPKGSLQLESGLQMMYQNGERELLLPTNLFRFGLTNSLELRLVHEVQAIRRSLSGGEVHNDGIGDIELGAKLWLAGGEDAKTNIGLVSHVGLKTGNARFTENENYVIAFLAVNHDLSDNFAIAYNLGYRSAEDHLFYTLAFAQSVSKKVGVYVEPYGSYSDEQGENINIDAGFTYLFNPNTQLDFSFGTGITSTMNYVSLGMSWLWQ